MVSLQSLCYAIAILFKDLKNSTTSEAKHLINLSTLFTLLFPSLK